MGMYATMYDGTELKLTGVLAEAADELGCIDQESYCCIIPNHMLDDFIFAIATKLEQLASKSAWRISLGTVGELATGYHKLHFLMYHKAFDESGKDIVFI